MSTRPSRNAPPPPPAANALYCHTCGRIITSRKHPTSTPQKYCSDRCRRQKPYPSTTATGTSLETIIERTFVRLLGEKRVVECGEVEREVFTGRGGGEGGGEDGGGFGREEGGEGEREGGVEGGVGNDDEDDVEEGGGGVSLTSLAPVSGSGSTSTSTAGTEAMTRVKVDGRREEEEEGLTSQQLGVRKAKEREMVRQAGRRGVAFGFEVEGEGVRRKVDCVRGGRVVESSFAKGEWGVRWRE